MDGRDEMLTWSTGVACPLDPRIISAVEKLTGPMIELLVTTTAFPPKRLAVDVEGLALVDKLPPVLLSCYHFPPKLKGIPFSSDLLRTHRDFLNLAVVAELQRCLL